MPFIWLTGGTPEKPAPIAEPPKVKNVRGAEPVQPVKSGSREQDAYQKAGSRPDTKQRKPATLVKQIMTSPVETMTPDTTVAEAQNLFGDRRFHHVPIVSKDGALVGVLSDRNLLRRDKGRVEDVMTKKVLTATPDTPIREAAEVMVAENISCLPILDPAHKLVGIVSRTDILRTVVNHAPLDLWT